jgi:hypothetical protein
MHLQAELPDELRAPIYWDAIPVKRVGIRFGFLVARAEQPDLGVRPCCSPKLGIASHASIG